jgi:hypothetical protein
MTQRRCHCGTPGRQSITQAQAVPLRRNGRFTSIRDVAQTSQILQMVHHPAMQA